MKTVTRYESIDGSIHDTEDRAWNRDYVVNRVVAIMKPLGDTPDEVMNGKGWCHHNLETVMVAKDRILDLCREMEMGSTLPAFQSRGRDCHPMSIIGRVLDDYGGPINAAWSRFCRIDEQGREHQQPYYAYTNGPLPEHVCVEDRR